MPIRPNTTLSYYMTDGEHGLDMSTAYFNLGTVITPATDINKLFYSITKIDETKINDGIPDILTTQTGSPGGSDLFYFVDSDENIIGVSKSVDYGKVLKVDTPIVSFYSPVSGTPSFPVSFRDFRLLSFELSEFNIPEADISKITHFVHQLTGNSDIAFSAYNRESFVINPVDLSVAMNLGTTCEPTIEVSVKNESATQTATVSKINVTLPAGVTVSGTVADYQNGVISVGELSPQQTQTFVLPLSVIFGQTVTITATLDEDFYLKDTDKTNNTESVTTIFTPRPTASVATSKSAICVNDNAIFVISGTVSAVVTYTINGTASTTTIPASGTSTITIENATQTQTLVLTKAA